MQHHPPAVHLSELALFPAKIRLLGFPSLNLRKKLRNNWLFGVQTFKQNQPTAYTHMGSRDLSLSDFLFLFFFFFFLSSLFPVSSIPDVSNSLFGWNPIPHPLPIHKTTKRKCFLNNFSFCSFFVLVGRKKQGTKWINFIHFVLTREKDARSYSLRVSVLPFHLSQARVLRTPERDWGWSSHLMLISWHCGAIYKFCDPLILI